MKGQVALINAYSKRLLSRGERIMLKNLPIMLCCTAPKMHLLCSTNVPIMLRLCSLNCQESVIMDI